MDTPMRPSGIPAVGDLTWGSHFCHFYRDRADLVDSLVPFFKAGLEHDEQCLWVTSEPFGAEDARAMLRAAVPDLDSRIHRGDIEIVDHRDWYRWAGNTNADEVLRGWVERKDRALAGGYAGLRLSGNTYWLERQDWQGFIDYESRVSETFYGQNIIGLCSYCFNRCSSEDVVDVVRNHQFALTRRAGEWDIIESASLKLAKEELRKLNADLERRVEERTAELREALRIRDQFLSVASHELKTPITSLQLYVDGLVRAQQREPLPPDQVIARLAKAKDQCGRLERLINNLLDVSRASAGTLPMEVEKVDLAEVARTSTERLSEDLRRAGCQVTLDASEPIIGTWDRLRLEQVITNLLSNVVKYAAGTWVEVSVIDEGDQAKLIVRDGGEGIPEKDQKRIFERFVQVSPKAQQGGFGLGLWIIRQIVEAHGGSIAVTSGVGAGSTFTVTLPRHRDSL